MLTLKLSENLGPKFSALDCKKIGLLGKSLKLKEYIGSSEDSWFSTLSITNSKFGSTVNGVLGVTVMVGVGVDPGVLVIVADGVTVGVIEGDGLTLIVGVTDGVGAMKLLPIFWNFKTECLK